MRARTTPMKRHSDDPGLALFDTMACVMLRVFWRCVLQPILSHDPSLPQAERVGRMQKMIVALLYAEARLKRVIHAAARRMCGLPPLRAPLQA